MTPANRNHSLGFPAPRRGTIPPVAHGCAACTGTRLRQKNGIEPVVVWAEAGVAHRCAAPYRRGRVGCARRVA